MSARAARSRKAVDKDIEKKEKKAAVVGKNRAVESIRRPLDAFPSKILGGGDTGASSRVFSSSSDASRGTSRSSSTNPGSARPHLNKVHSYESLEPKSLHRSKTSMSGSTSISEGSISGKNKAKYQAKGKETKAPRGRGGGVPLRQPSTTGPPPSPLYRSETSASYVPPNQKTWINFRVWEAGHDGLQPYGGFEYDEHMQTGTVLIYFKEEQTLEDRPIPQLRAELQVLENSGSAWLNNALLLGRVDENEDEWTLPGSPHSTIPSQFFPPANYSQTVGQRRMLGPTSPGGISPPPFNIDQAYFGGPGARSASAAQYYSDLDYSGRSPSPPPFQTRAEPQPTHELWFTAPSQIRTPQGQRLHHVAVRNFLALLHNKPIVGADLFEMLSTLQPEIQVMYDLEHDNGSRLSARERSVQMITKYLCQHRFDDVRHSIKRALGLLAWAEQDNVRWRQGYLESFVHLAGVLSPQIEELPDFKRLSIATRRNLDIAAKSLQLRVMEAEEKLSTFDFAEFWPQSAKANTSGAYQSYTAFRQFLVNHYTRIYGNWPPSQSRTWLNRKVILALQEDFGALYDYLVNRDVVWDPREERPGKKWEMVNRRSEDFRADGPELSLTDMLVTFDNIHGYMHIPHPYPLLPKEVQSEKAPPKKSFFSGLKKNKTDATKDAKAQLQLSIVFSDATNLEKMDVSFNGSTLIDQYERFELGADLNTATPREARLGRWVLLYGILQVISSLSVDVPDAKWTEGVRSFLCTDLKRCPDWVTKGQTEYMEASQIRSWCWQRPWAPTPIVGAPVELEANPTSVVPEVEVEILDGATVVNSDIRRISKKIEGMGLGPSGSLNPHREYERRIENEKIKHDEMVDFGMKQRQDNTFRLTVSDFTERTQAPMRSSLLSPLSQPATLDFSPGPTGNRSGGLQGQVVSSRGFYNDDREGWR